LLAVAGVRRGMRDGVAGSVPSAGIARFVPWRGLGIIAGAAVTLGSVATLVAARQLVGLRA